MKPSWDSAWEKVFQEREWGKYPPEELIRFVARNFYKAPDRTSIKILDIGCGTGACTWYLAREGFSAYGIDGSKTAIAISIRMLEMEALKAEFVVGDLIQLPYPDGFFDGVIDVAAIECNKIANVKEIFAQVYRALRPGGKFFSIAIKTGSYGYGEGDEIERNTFTNVRVGPHKGQGIIHFFTEREIRHLLNLNQFKNIEIEWSARTLNNQKNKIIHWIVTTQK
jgi:ubiquinone/menaquinone biosynthesis C-methylase UbiE